MLAYVNFLKKNLFPTLFFVRSSDLQPSIKKINQTHGQCLTRSTTVS